MDHGDVPINVLVNAVLDGQPVDWGSAESGASSEDRRARIRHFRTLAAIAALHREPDAAQTKTPAAPTALWGSLRLLDRIGEGTFGEVYRAWDTRLAREVALKLGRHRDPAADGSEELALEEGRLLARVRHPNVVTVFGADRIGDRVGLWMEFIRGRTLQQVLATHGALSAREATAIGLDLCPALSAVHRAGLLHRDVKAQNVMREDGGRIVLMDFGAGRERLDETGSELAGTPLYLAPEVFAGNPATVRSDIYSMGVLLYHLATGSYPVKGQTTAELRAAHRDRQRTWLRDERPELPEKFVQAVERALEFDPDRRYESAGAMEAALAGVMSASDSATATPAPAALAPSPTIADAARPRVSRRLALAAAVLLTVGLGVAGWMSRSRPTPPAERPWILVAAFENRTGDPRLDDVVQFAFEQELTQSRALTVVPRERIDDALRLMKRPAGTRVDSALAREVAIRDGEIALFATGRIDRVGQNYALNVTVSSTRSNGSIARAGVDVATLDAVLGGVKTLTSRVRTAIGEDSRQVEADAQLEKVTTSSFEALQAYTRGYAFGTEGKWAAAELPNVYAARYTVQHRGLKEAKPFVDRAVSLMPADAETVPTEAYAVAWLKGFPEFELWSRGDVRGAADLLDRLSHQELAADQSPGRTLGVYVGTLNLALGRVGAAEDAFRTISIDRGRQQYLAISALARDDRAGAVRAVRDDPRLAQPPATGDWNWQMAVKTLLHLGLTDQATELLQRYQSHLIEDRLAYLSVWSEVLAARGDTESAIPMLREYQATLPPSPTVFWRALATEANILTNQGDLASAATLLRRTELTREHAYPSWESSAYWWLRARVRLLQVERQLGNTARASAIQQELRQLMAVADPDFALLRDLN